MLRMFANPKGSLHDNQGYSKIDYNDRNIVKNSRIKNVCINKISVMIHDNTSFNKFVG